MQPRGRRKMSVFDYFKCRRANNSTHVEEKKVQKKSNQEKLWLNTLAQNVQEDKKLYPEDAENMERFLQDILKDPERYQVQTGPDSDETSDSKIKAKDAYAKVFITKDKMAAYICLFPSSDGGKEITVEAILEELRYEGVTYGIQDRFLLHVVQERMYLRILLAAKGTKPKDGEDGEVIEFVDRKSFYSLKAPEDGIIDFGETELFQIVEKGAVLCRIKEPVPREEGSDVTGRVLHGRVGNTAPIPRGKNTEISRDGKMLIAGIGGVLYSEIGKFCIEKRIILNSVDKHTGNLDFVGDILITGNVTGGSINADGDIIVEGSVQNASIISGGTIRIQQGIKKGQHGSKLKAEKEIQCSIIEGAEVTAGGSIYAEVIMDSDVTSGESIYVVGGRGLLAGGKVCARKLITAKRIGNQSDCLNTITIGYQPKLQKELDEIKHNLVVTRSTLDKIRKNVATLKAVTMLSLEKRAVLAQLMEQRDLYNNKEQTLIKREQELKLKSQENTTGKVVCEELYPLTEISLGPMKVTVDTIETNCNIHLYAGRLILH